MKTLLILLFLLMLSCEQKPLSGPRTLSDCYWENSKQWQVEHCLACYSVHRTCRWEQETANNIPIKREEGCPWKGERWSQYRFGC